MSQSIHRDTPAWKFQVWASFVLAFGVTLVGIAWLPIDIWVKAFLVMGVLFTTGSAFTLAKTIRDELEADRLESRVPEVAPPRGFTGEAGRGWTPPAASQA